MKKYLVNAIHDEYGYYGWYIKDSLYPFPIDRHGIAHDIIEHPIKHNQEKNLAFAELEALGAAFMFRCKTGLTRLGKPFQAEDILSDITLFSNELVNPLDYSIDIKVHPLLDEVAKQIPSYFEQNGICYDNKCFDELVLTTSQLMTSGWNKFKCRFKNLNIPFNLYNSIVDALSYHNPEHQEDLVLYYQVNKGLAFVELATIQENYEN